MCWWKINPVVVGCLVRSKPKSWPLSELCDNQTKLLK